MFVCLFLKTLSLKMWAANIIAFWKKKSLPALQFIDDNIGMGYNTMSSLLIGILIVANLLTSGKPQVNDELK